jgi:NAD(P)-dependent dehydrogenase (short-subunit alcohol dehydrogenase family)
MSDYTSRFNVQGKRALVTGASRGIGAEIATLVADAGADVGIVGRDAEGLEATGKLSPVRVAVASLSRRICKRSRGRASPVPRPSSFSERWTSS